MAALLWGKCLQTRFSRGVPIGDELKGEEARLNSTSDSPTDRSSLRAATLAGAFTAAMGILVLVGWYTHNVTLIQVFPAFVPMQYNTALGFVLCGSGLVALTHDRFLLAGALGSAAGVIGLLTLIEYLFGVQLGLDELFLEHYIRSASR